MAVVQDIVNAAFKRLGVTAEAELPSTDDSNDALVALNDLLDQWAAERLQIYTIVNTTFPIVPSQASYTVGPTGNVNMARPQFIDHVNYINTSFSPSLESQLNPLTDDAWSKIPVKGLTNTLPTSWWWQTTYPLGTLYLWPVPTSATLQGSIYASQAVPAFATLQTAVALPPGYRRMLVSNLAVELAPDYGAVIAPTLLKIAEESVAAVKRSNKKLLDMSIDSAALVQGRNRSYWYSIFAGP